MTVPGAPVARDPVVVTASPRRAAVIRLEVPVVGLGMALGEALREVAGAIATNSLFPTGSPFAHYLSFGGEMVVVDVGFPVSGQIIPTGRVIRGELPGGTIATTLHVGPYETIGETYGRLDAWIRARGNTPAATMWEIYQRGPGQEPDPSKWRTEVYWPFG